MVHTQINFFRQYINIFNLATLLVELEQILLNTFYTSSHMTSSTQKLPLSLWIVKSIDPDYRPR